MVAAIHISDGPYVPDENGTTLDPCLIYRPVTITHGRSGVSYQPDAPMCEFEYVGPEPPAALGQTVTVTEGYPDHDGARWVDDRFRWIDPGISWTGIARSSYRFVGNVTGLQAVESLGTVTVYRVRATGVQALLGVTPVLLSRPAETDIARAAAIFEAAGVPYVIDGPAGLTLAPDEIDRDALAALHQLCESAAALLWQGRDGVMHYGTMKHRDSPPVAVLPCSVLLDGIEWYNDIEAIVNHVTVTWGPQDEQTQETHRDDDSIAIWGVRHVTVSTLAADGAEARLLALTILARRASPWWYMPDVIVDHGALSIPDTRAMLDLEVSQGVFLPIPNTPGNTPDTLKPWTVEGWVESWPEDGTHLTQLSVSDRTRAGVGAGMRNWSDMAAEDWQHWTAGTWLAQLVKETT